MPYRVLIALFLAWGFPTSALADSMFVLAEGNRSCGLWTDAHAPKGPRDVRWVSFDEWLAAHASGS